MIDWTQVLMALAVGLPATVTAVGAILLGWHNGRKIDDNTIITRAGAVASAANAKVAAIAASSAESKVDDLAVQMNGKLEARVRAIIREELAEMAVNLKREKS